MKIDTIFIILIVSLIGFFAIETYDQGQRETPVLRVELNVTGIFNDPVIDVSNTDRYIELIPIHKQSRKSPNIEGNAILCDIYYEQNLISYGTVIPYNGPGTYSLNVNFLDNVALPKSNNDSVIAWVRFVVNDKVIRTQYVVIWWINETDLQ